MKRSIYQQLLGWKAKRNRKPLLLNGARQVGKTCILKEFGRREYAKVAYVNCGKNKLVSKILAQDYDIRRILLSLSALVHENTEPGNTLIIFDEKPYQEQEWMVNKPLYAPSAWI
ncbi:MAG TPA: hypothetical protein DDW22_02815 [Prevotellaceae bacterium]|nr:hypothetical protein [Prevotellaceae bacterium]